jgi:Zn-dependent protease with chaperone function
MAEQKPGRLLNPFAFPSETQLRSILLSWAILGLCWGVGFFFTRVLANNVGWPDISELPSLDRDILNIEEEHPSIVPSPSILREWFERMEEAYRALEKPEELARTQVALTGLSAAARSRLKMMLPYFMIPLLFLALSLLCILALYVVRARLLWRSGRASPRAGDKPQLQNALHTLIREAQEQQRQRGERPIPQPRFLFSRGAVGDGQAFGSSRRPVILLTRAMSSILRRDLRQRGKPYEFRATVLHELAHLANRDVTRSYWAEASWIILIPVLTLLMATLWMLWSSPEAPGWLQVGAHVMALLLVVELIRRGILRAREHDADLRTALLWDAGEPLRSSLAEDENAPGSPDRVLKRFARLWRNHPTAAERRDLLDHPSRAFALTLDVPCLAGLLFGNLIVNILLVTAVIVLTTDALGILMTNSIIEALGRSRGLVLAMRLYYPLGSFLWSTLMFFSAFALVCAVSYFLAGTLGVQTQRESLLQVVEAGRNPHPYRALLKPAFFTAVGFQIGLILAPMTLVSPGQAWGFLSLIVWVLFATLPFWGWLSAIRFFARRLLGTHLAVRRPVRQLRIVTWASTILLWPLIVTLLGGQFWIWPSMQLIRGKGALAMGSIGVLGFLFLLALMLLALAVREVRREERRPRCPHCGSEPPSPSAAANCAACGNSVAPWLFVEAPPALEEGVA